MIARVVCENLVAVMYLSKDKLCNSRSAKRKLLAKDRQKLANKSEKLKHLARICQKVALRDDLEKGRGKASQTGTSESHDDISTGLKVKTKTIRVLLDTGSSGDLLFMQKGKIDIPIVKRAVPQSWTLPMAPSKLRGWATLNCPLWTTPPVKGFE